MKKLLISLFLLSLIVFSSTKVQAIGFGEAINQKKPCAVLIYADWADNIDDIKSAFDSLQAVYSNKYNFVNINISKEEAKEFNKTNYIYPNLPYILLFKERGRMSRCITQECIQSDSCLKEKLDLFAN